MEFDLPSEDDPRRAEVRRWLAEHPRRPGGRWPRPATSRRTGRSRRGSTPTRSTSSSSTTSCGGRACAGPSNQIGIGWAGPTILLRRHARRRRTATSSRCSRPRRSGASSSASPGPGSDLAILQHASGARRRRVRRQRPEDLDVGRPHREVRHPHRPDRSRRAEAQGHLVLHLPDGHARASRSGRSSR